MLIKTIACSKMRRHAHYKCKTLTHPWGWAIITALILWTISCLSRAWPKTDWTFLIRTWPTVMYNRALLMRQCPFLFAVIFRVYMKRCLIRFCKWTTYRRRRLSIHSTYIWIMTKYFKQERELAPAVASSSFLMTKSSLSKLSKNKK